MDFKLVDNMTPEQQKSCDSACSVLISLIPTFQADLKKEKDNEELDIQQLGVSSFKAWVKSRLLVLPASGLKSLCEQVKLQESQLADLYLPEAQLAIWRYWPVALATLRPDPESPVEWVQVTYTAAQENGKIVQSGATTVAPVQVSSAGLLDMLYYNLSMFLHRSLSESIARSTWKPLGESGVNLPDMPDFAEALAERRNAVAAVKAAAEAGQDVGNISGKEIMGTPGILQGPPPAVATIKEPEVIVPPNYPKS